MIKDFGNIYLVRKPVGVASSWGSQVSILSMIEEGFLEDFRIQGDYWRKEAIDKAIALYSGTKEVDLEEFLANQQQFGHIREYGLLNRLDNPTAGFLYFAKDQEIYAQWKKKQDKKFLLKHYYAVVEGKIGNYFIYGSKNDDILIEGDKIVVSRSLMHDKYDETKMIPISEPANRKKGRGKVQYAQSTIDLVEYNEKEDVSLIHIAINSGKRHQIRVHCASLGHPIIGDDLYSDCDGDDLLHLWSVGVDVG